MPEKHTPQNAMQKPDAAESYRIGRILLYLGAALAVLLISAFYLDGCEKDESSARLSAQVDTSAAKQLQALRVDQFHDSIANVAVRMQLNDVSAKLDKQRDSTAWLQEINARHMEGRKQMDKLFLLSLNGQKEAFRDMLNRKLDSLAGRIDTLTGLQSDMARMLVDSAYMGRLAKTSLRQVTGVIKPRTEWVDYEVVFSKTLEGADTIYILPTIRNEFEVQVTKSVPARKRKAGYVIIDVTERNPYAVQGQKTFRLPILPNAKKQKGSGKVRHKTKRTQTVNWFDRAINYLFR